MLSSHISAINSRVARLKKERVAQELMAQQSRYAAAAKKLSTEVDNIKSVSEALSSRITKIDAEAKPLLATETTEMRKSLGAAGPCPRCGQARRRPGRRAYRRRQAQVHGGGRRGGGGGGGRRALHAAPQPPRVSAAAKATRGDGLEVEGCKRLARTRAVGHRCGAAARDGRRWQQQGG